MKPSPQWLRCGQRDARPVRIHGVRNHVDGGIRHSKMVWASILEKQVAGHNLRNSPEEGLTAVLFEGQKTGDGDTWRTNRTSIPGSRCD